MVCTGPLSLYERVSQVAFCFFTAEAQRRRVLDNQYLITQRLCASAVKCTFETPSKLPYFRLI
jgi:hypothetical protein